MPIKLDLKSPIPEAVGRDKDESYPQSVVDRPQGSKGLDTGSGRAGLRPVPLKEEGKPSQAKSFELV